MRIEEQKRLKKEMWRKQEKKEVQQRKEEVRGVE